MTLYHEKAEKMGRPLEAALLIGPPPQVFLAQARSSTTSTAAFERKRVPGADTLDLGTYLPGASSSD